LNAITVSGLDESTQYLLYCASTPSTYKNAVKIYALYFAFMWPTPPPLHWPLSSPVHIC